MCGGRLADERESIKTSGGGRFINSPEEQVVFQVFRGSEVLRTRAWCVQSLLNCLPPGVGNFAVLTSGKSWKTNVLHESTS